MLKITEKILLRQIKNGDEQAFTFFYNHYKDKIYRFIYFKVSHEERADDLVNDTFIKVFHYLRDGEDEIGNFQAFLYKTARNLVIDFYRTRKQEVSLENSLEIASETEIDQEVNYVINMENIEKAVKKLPDDYNQVLTLKFINNLNFQEISEITGKSAGTCRVLAHRGVKKLKQILAQK